MTKIRKVSLVFITLCGFMNTLQEADCALNGAGSKPNILIIFTDDQGYGDLACYGNEKNKTPRLDQLANEGTLFTSFYSQTVCGPSRSALLTGRQPRRSQGWSMPADEITWAELIRDVGYQTACIGKWDVSNRKPIIDRMPNAQGFDYYFGTLGANDSGKVKFHENNDEAGTTDDMGSLITLYTDKSIQYLKEKRDPDKPFVLYLAHTMMHTIIDASDRFRGTSAGGLTVMLSKSLTMRPAACSIRLMNLISVRILWSFIQVIMGHGTNQSTPTKKRGTLKTLFSGENLAPYATGKGRVMKAATACHALFAGLARLLPASSPMQFLRLLISCPPSQDSLDSACPLIDILMVLIRQNFCSISGRLDETIFTLKNLVSDKASGSISKPMRSFITLPLKMIGRR